MLKYLNHKKYFSNGNKLKNKILSLPIDENLNVNEINYIVNKLNQFCKKVFMISKKLKEKLKELRIIKLYLLIKIEFFKKIEHIKMIFRKKFNQQYIPDIYNNINIEVYQVCVT